MAQIKNNFKQKSTAVRADNETVVKNKPALSPKNREALETQVAKAAVMNDLDAVKAILAQLSEAGVQSIHEARGGQDASTPFMAMALNGNLEGLRLLSDWCDEEAGDRLRESVFCAAAESGSVECLRFLAPKHAHKRERDGSTPLHAAARAGVASTDALQFLAELADPNERDHSGATALHEAAWGSHVEACRFLMTVCDPLAKDDNGDTALGNAVMVNAVEVVRLLEPVSDVNAQSGDGWTPALVTTTQETADSLRILSRRADWSIRAEWTSPDGVEGDPENALELSLHVSDDHNGVLECANELAKHFPLDDVKKALATLGEKAQEKMPAGFARVEAEKLRKAIGEGEAAHEKGAPRSAKPSSRL